MRFALDGRIVDVTPTGDGHIHTSYVVTTDADSPGYLLQRLNTTVFPNTASVTGNIDRVARHQRRRAIAEGIDPRRHVLTIVPTRRGDLVATDEDGGVWRAYVRIGRATAHSEIRSARQAEEIGRGFGRFLRWMSDFPVEDLEPVLPRLHDVGHHLAAFDTAVRGDRMGRATDAAAERAFIESRREPVAEWADLLAAGRLPRRTIHGDTKLNNVLLDDDDGHAMCVIDLDTVMAGTMLHDIGDCLRSALGGDAASMSGASSSAWDVVRSLWSGYLDEASGLITAEECERVAEAARMETLCVGIRFLTDHLDGDRYFRTTAAGENLVRSRRHLDVVRRIEAERRRMTDIVLDVAGQTGSRDGTGRTESVD